MSVRQTSWRASVLAVGRFGGKGGGAWQWSRRQTHPTYDRSAALFVCKPAQTVFNGAWDHCWERRCPHRLWVRLRCTGKRYVTRELFSVAMAHGRSPEPMWTSALPVRNARPTYDGCGDSPPVHERTATRHGVRASSQSGGLAERAAGCGCGLDAKHDRPTSGVPPTSSSPPAARLCRPAWRRVRRPDGLFVWLRTPPAFWRGLRRGGLWLLLRRQRVFGARRPGRL